jgi:hypothetical protein
LDTTPYADGVHTIQWTALDSAGNTDGIGSRYFTIQNSGGSTANKSAASRLNTMGSVFKGEISRLSRDYSRPIRVKRGLNNITPEKINSGYDGVTTLIIKQLERVEIQFPGETLIASGLPVGSTLDSKAGIFYWFPGPAFLGDYTFDFIVREGIPGKLTRKQVKIKILPEAKYSVGHK